jgi:AraC family transcriptional regulator, regulatory protein of adaptative response / methylated-DNA-[protein]-cysteine methyltransferase
MSERYGALIANACRLLEGTEKPPALAELAAQAGISSWHFHRLFKAVTGLTPRDYALMHRAQRVRNQLKQSETVTEAIFNAGYNANSRFYEKSAQLLGMTPRQYKAGGVDTDIRFAVGQCSLGAILVASTHVGICSIQLGDDPDVLVRNLQDSFPQAKLIGRDREYEQLVAKVVGFVETPQLGLDLPLDIRGTAFQQRVWQALSKIPSGTTVSYAELAASIGAPKAIRAVASACAANKLAVAIPCHRVVRTDGSLSGYRWGAARKRALLECEAKQKARETN